MKQFVGINGIVCVGVGWGGRVAQGVISYPIICDGDKVVGSGIGVIQIAVPKFNTLNVLLNSNELIKTIFDPAVTIPKCEKKHLVQVNLPENKQPEFMKKNWIFNNCS